jgi:hypothetical protein
MSYTYHGASNLIQLPGRSVQTYPSGLVRVERSFVCRKNDANLYRERFKGGNLMPDDDGAPAIDGLYIFPEPQEAVRDDGFVEFRVTAYGRCSFDDYIIKGTKQVDIFFLEPEVDFFDFSDTFNFNKALAETYTIKRCLPSSVNIKDVIAAPPSIFSNIVYLGNPEGLLRKNIVIQGKLQLSQFSSISFGFFSEFTYTYEVLTALGIQRLT